MPLNLADRLLTIAVTATLTSAAWIVIGSGYVERKEPAGSVSVREKPKSVANEQQLVRPSPNGAAEGALPEGLIVPVVGIAPSQLIDTFGDPRGGGTRPHEALDVPAPVGTPVVAAAPGTIEKLFYSDAGGKTIYIRSADRRTIYYYAHLDEYAPGLTEGQSVPRGAQLGTVGSTGNADPSAPHLHFAIMRAAPDAEWWEPAPAMNPFSLLRGT